MSRRSCRVGVTTKLITCLLLLLIGFAIAAQETNLSQAQASAVRAQQLLEQGYSNYESGNLNKANEIYRQALEIAAEADDPALNAEIYYRIGRTEWKRQQYPSALDAFQQALALVKEQGSPRDQGMLHNTIGTVHETLGQIDSARDQYTRALALRREVGDRLGEVRTLINLGSTYVAHGRYIKALGFYRSARTIADSLKPRPLREVSAILTHTGSLFAEIGQYDKALDFHRKALRTYEEQGDQSGVASSWHNIGYTHAEQQDYPLAIAAFRKALAVREKIGDKYGRAGTLNNLGLTLSDAKQPHEALQVLSEALETLEELNTRTEEAATLDSIGTVYLSLNDHAKALEHYYNSLVIWRHIDHRDGERITLGNIGTALELANEIEAAIVYYKLSVNISQAIRSELSVLQKAEQRAYIRRVEDFYRRLADLLIRRGRLPEAQQVLGMLKEQEYFEFIRRDAGRSKGLDSVIAFTRLEAPLVERYGQLSDRVAALGREFGVLDEIPRDERTDVQQTRREELHKELTDVDNAFQVFMGDLREELRNLSSERAAELGEKQLRFLRRQQGMLQELHQQRPVMVHYVVLEERVQIILTTPYTQLARHVDLPEPELNLRIQALRETVVNDPSRDPRPAARDLYELLIAPIAPALEQADARTLVVSLDRALRYLPFSSLYDGKRYLTERYAVVMLTEAAKGDLTDQPQSDWTVAGFGVSKGHEGFQPLPAVPAELEGIVLHGEADPDGVLPGEVFLDELFTERALAAALDERHPVVHIASHFSFRPGTDTDSFLLMGDGTHLSLADLADKNFTFFPVDLFTLSACDTAMGSGVYGSGSEVEGLGAQIQNQGARSVLATLWSVEDASTGQLMQRFYALRASGYTKSEALRQAQLAFLRGSAAVADSVADRGQLVTIDHPEKDAGSPPLSAAQDPRYAHPHYWAPFILMGNWL